jgi:hypothetical protein
MIIILYLLLLHLFNLYVLQLNIHQFLFIKITYFQVVCFNDVVIFNLYTSNLLVYSQIVKHEFACTHSPAVQSKNQTSGYIDTCLLILFVAIDTSSIFFVSLCKRKSFLRSWIFSSRSKEEGNGTQLRSFPDRCFEYASNPLPLSCTR